VGPQISVTVKKNGFQMDFEQVDIFTQDESAFEDARDREGHEESEEQEHHVVHGEGGEDAGNGLIEEEGYGEVNPTFHA